VLDLKLKLGCFLLSIVHVSEAAVAYKIKHFQDGFSAWNIFANDLNMQLHAKKRNSIFCKLFASHAVTTLRAFHKHQNF